MLKTFKKTFFTVRTDRVLNTFKNSAVNAVFPVRPIVELVFSKYLERTKM